jgi:hypothetical protein
MILNSVSGIVGEDHITWTGAPERLPAVRRGVFRNVDFECLLPS